MSDIYTDQELYKRVQEYESRRAAARHLGIPESTLRQRLKDYTPELPKHAYTPEPEALPATHTSKAKVTSLAKSGVVQRFILTSAQNNVRVHGEFLANLKALAKHLKAKLMISYTVYDKMGYRGVVRKGETKVKRDVWWDVATKRYACNERTMLHPQLAFCGELDILASVSRPLSGLESYCGHKSLIVPHNRFAFECVASRKGHLPKEMHTTGSVTLPHFVQRKTGQLAEFHHVLGALLIEVTADGFFHVHHLNADKEGAFHWLDKFVGSGVVISPDEQIAGIVLGDFHTGKMDKRIHQITVNLLRTLQPKTVVIHDVIDFHSRFHYDIKDPFFRAQMEEEENSVEDELRGTAENLKLFQHNVPAQFVVTASNHDNALLRWIKETDWRDDPRNAEIYLTIARGLTRQLQRGVRAVDLRPLAWILRTQYGVPEQINFLHPDESFEIVGIECGMHGHVGPSGTRGNPRSISRLGFKTFTGHTHSPSIVDGCYTVGTSSKLDMGYNVGPSKWMHAHGIVYPNGKRAFIFIKNGQWRA